MRLKATPSARSIALYHGTMLLICLLAIQALVFPPLFTWLNAVGLVAGVISAVLGLIAIKRDERLVAYNASLPTRHRIAVFGSLLVVLVVGVVAWLSRL